MLHVFLAPSPEAVEDVLLVKLHGSHHSILLPSVLIIISLCRWHIPWNRPPRNKPCSYCRIHHWTLRSPSCQYQPAYSPSRQKIAILVSFKSSLFPKAAHQKPSQSTSHRLPLCKDTWSMNVLRGMETWAADIQGCRLRNLHLRWYYPSCHRLWPLKHTALWDLARTVISSTFSLPKSTLLYIGQYSI